MRISRVSRITIIRTQKRKSFNVNELLQWFGGTLGLFNLRDKDSSCFRVFIILLRDIKRGGEGLTSDELAGLTKLSRGTVVHHLNRLMMSGLVVSEGNKYFLKVDNLGDLVELVRADTNRTLDSLKDIGKDIDKLLDE